MKKTCFLLVNIFLILLLTSAPAVLAENNALLEGIDLYKQGNYDSAVEKLKLAVENEPDSGTATFFLGLSYKQLREFPKAADAFRSAVSGTLRIKEALVELINVLIKMGSPENLAEAETWIAVAEREQIQPAKVAFLKGMLLSRQGHSTEAVSYFEKAMDLDESYTQTSEFQIAMTYIKEKKLEEAQKRLKSVLLYDPNSTMAGFARQYQASVTERMDRVFRFRLGAFALYDDNLLLQWQDKEGAPPWPGGISDTPGLNGTFRADWAPVMPGNWLFNTQLAFSGTLYKENSTGSDTLSSGIYMAPGYNFGKYALNLVVNYNYASKKRPYYQESSQYFSIGPMTRWVLKANHLLELFAGYDRKEFALPSLSPKGDRDSDSLRAYLSWIYSHGSGAFFNLRYTYLDENADGEWWDNTGHAGLLNLSYPITDKFNLQLNGEINFKAYETASPDPRIINGTPVTFMTKRRDDIYRGGIGFNYKLMKKLLLVANYSHTYQDSNVAIYNYYRNIISAGLELSF